MTLLDTFKLDGQVALVTVGGSGLGWSMAEAMAEAGADVVCVDWHDNRAKEAAEMIRAVGRSWVSHQCRCIKGGRRKENGGADCG